MEIIRGTGKLCDTNQKQVIATVDYTIWLTPPTKFTLGEWHGDFIPEDEHLFIQGEYIIELQDKRKGKIIVTNIEIEPGVPTHYQFQGSGSLIL